MKTTKRYLAIKTKKGVFRVVFESGADEKGYTVRVPGLPEIVTGGISFSEAKKMAREAIEFCFKCRAEEIRRISSQRHEHYTHPQGKRSASVAAPARV